METTFLRRAETAAASIPHKNSGNSGMLECFRPQTGANSRFCYKFLRNMETCEFLWRSGESSVSTRGGSPTFGGSGSTQVIDGSQDEPQGPLLLSGHSQDLHGRLQFGELLSSPLLLLGLHRSKVAIHPTQMPGKVGKSLEKIGQTDLGMWEDPEGALLSQVVEVQLGSERNGSKCSGE